MRTSRTRTRTRRSAGHAGTTRRARTSSRRRRRTARGGDGVKPPGRVTPAPVRLFLVPLVVGAHLDVLRPPDFERLRGLDVLGEPCPLCPVEELEPLDLTC